MLALSPTSRARRAFFFDGTSSPCRPKLARVISCWPSSRTQQKARLATPSPRGAPAAGALDGLLPLAVETLESMFFGLVWEFWFWFLGFLVSEWPRVWHASTNPLGRVWRRISLGPGVLRASNAPSFTPAYFSPTQHRRRWLPIVLPPHGGKRRSRFSLDFPQQPLPGARFTSTTS